MDMDMDMVLISLLISFFLGACSIIAGIPINSSNGSVSGYVVRTYTKGVFFKTNGVTLKTSDQSSFSRSYCIKDKKVFDEVKHLQNNKKNTTFKFYSNITNGLFHCNGEDYIISGVT